MNYVESFNLFGVDAKQIPSILGSGAPTNDTEGAVGCFYMDTDTGTVYKCTAAESGVYTWEEFNGSGSAKGAVLYTSQQLTYEQQAQARENIGAMGIDSYNMTFGGDVTVGNMISANQVAANTVLTNTIVGPVTFVHNVLCDYELNVTERLSASQIYAHEDIYVQDDKKVATEEYVNTTLGGVETALDSILAIQNELIGGDA